MYGCAHLSASRITIHACVSRSTLHAALAGLVEPVESEQGKDTSFSEALMVLHGFSGSRIDTLLSKLRKAGVGNIPYKAVLTPTNLRWTGPELCEELKKEHEAMQQGTSAHKVD